jgi:hypothetical protein
MRPEERPVDDVGPSWRRGQPEKICGVAVFLARADRDDIVVQTPQVGNGK